MKKILFILNTYGFQSKILNKKKSIDQNYNYFNSQDFNWPNYFFNNLKKDYITYKDYPYLNKKLLKKNDYLKYLKNKFKKIIIVDPHVDPVEAKKIYKIKIYKKIPNIKFNGIVFAVQHKEFMGKKFINKFKNINSEIVIYDIKNSVNELYLTGNL